MLPHFLQSSYARYKADTHTFATWLLETANQCGYQPPSLSFTDPLAEQGKNKSKSKNKKNGDGKEDVSGENTVQFTATIKDLRKLAEVVASSALTVPLPVLTIAKRAIKLRKSVTSWFMGHGDSENNKRHAHFITALEEICETLEWKTDRPSEPDAKQSTSTSGAESDDADASGFVNRFAVLTVEEPREFAQTEPAPVSTKKIVKVDIDEEDDQTESYLGQLYFKTLCLFQDLQSMRVFITQTWLEYREKKIDLMNASIVTDSALQIAKNLTEEVEAEWHTSGVLESDDVQSVIFKIATFLHGESPSASVEIGLPYNKNMADVAEWCYLPTKVLLESFANVLQDGQMPVFKKGYFGTYNPKANRELMSVGQKFNEDKIIFLSLLPEFCMFSSFGFRMPVEDMVTRGLVEFSKTKEVPLWLSFASQILLDVHHAMRYSSLSAFEDLRMSGLRIDKTVKDYIQLTKSHPQPQFWPKEGDDEIRAIGLAVKSWIVEDQFLKIRKNSSALRGLPIPDTHALFSEHSILCGLILFHLHMRLQSVGQQLVTQWYDVQQLAFLHNLVIQSPLYKDLRWPDMDAFIQIHGESHIFIGSRPKNASESLNRLELATGISSAANFARDTRKNRVHKPDGKTARLLEPTTAVANLFCAQYVKGVTQDAGIGNIDRVLDELIKKSNLENSSKELQRSNPKSIVSRQWSNFHNLSTLQLLAFLKTKLFIEEPVILFNYIGMHQRSIELLRLIRAKEHHKFVQYFTAAYMPNESFISNIVILIHHVARGSAETVREMGISSEGTIVSSRIVASAGDVMRDYLQKNGGVACKELRVFCKNKKPIHDDTDYDKGKEDDKLIYSWLSLEDVIGPKGIASLQTGIPIA